MGKRRVDLIDELGWRMRITNYLVLFSQTPMAEGQQEQILDDIGLLNLEMRQILKDEGKDDEGDDPPDDGPGDEGPLGPLPVGILTEMGKEVSYDES